MSKQHGKPEAPAPPETCANPYKNCINTNIAVYIMRGDRQLPIWRDCWADLAEKEWKR